MHAHLQLKDEKHSVKICDKDLQSIFSACFSTRYNTLLVGDASEPLYSPATTFANMHTIFYRYDYFSSALHEVAHWCIAGKQRRQQTDYGYWYAPDGRSAQQQHEFEAVEAKPQALEWAFSMACGIDFSVSIDNLDALENIDQTMLFEQQKRFTNAVKKQLNHYMENGFPPRAKAFLTMLNDFYNTPSIISVYKHQYD